MSARLSPGIARLVLAAVLCALSACSSFDRKWLAAANPATANGATRWAGHWMSGRHGNRNGAFEGGRLRCVLEPVAMDAVNANFHANWLAFSANFSLALQPVKHGGSKAATDFRGTHDLPAMFGGTYRYSAHIVGDRFTAHYDSSYDTGTFELSRVRP